VLASHGLSLSHILFFNYYLVFIFRHTLDFTKFCLSSDRIVVPSLSLLLSIYLSLPHLKHRKNAPYDSERDLHTKSLGIRFATFLTIISFWRPPHLLAVALLACIVRRAQHVECGQFKNLPYFFYFRRNLNRKFEPHFHRRLQIATDAFPLFWIIKIIKIILNLTPQLMQD
jgi:hypothetical protein